MPRSRSGVDYVKGTAVSSLTAIFGNSEEKPQEDSEKLLQLYWNRAELKKEFADLRKENYRLQERVREQEGATARAGQKLDHLEQLLLDPDWVYNVIIYYQLKHLNLSCQSKLNKFAEQLKRQREAREHGRLVERWNERRAAEAAAVEQEIGEQRLQVQMLEDRLQAEQHRLVTMNSLLRMFRRRSATATLDRLAAAVDAAQHQEQELLQAYDRIQCREPPDTQGLDIPTKRLINFMILSFAQHMYLYFCDDGLAEMAKEAGEKSVGAINYGGRRECDEIIARVRKRVAKFDKASQLADVLQMRAKLIADKARFRSDSDAVPVSGSVSTVYEIDGNGAVSETEANLLGENYWKLSEVVSR